MGSGNSQQEIFRVIYDDGNQQRRDALGRIVQRRETVFGESHDYFYHYDAAGRLADVCLDGNHYSHYEYDANGNRLLYQKCAAGALCNPGNRCQAVALERAGTYDEQDRLLAYGDASFAYTANGELYQKIDQDGITTYEYDELGNLVDVRLPDGRRVHYIIDGRNRRIGRQVYDTEDSVVEEQGYIYLDQLNPAAELDAAGNIVSVFVYATRPNVPDLMYSCKDPADPAAPCAAGATWHAYRVISDHLGSVRLVVSLDAANLGQVVQRLDYDEFGVVLTDTAPGFQPFGFAGGIFDSMTSTIKFGARDYSPQIGRWLLKDIMYYLVLDANTFVYSVNDPMNYSDTSGFGKINDIIDAITKGIKISNDWRIGPRFPKEPPDPRTIPEPVDLDKPAPEPPDLEKVLRCILAPSTCESPKTPTEDPCHENSLSRFPPDIQVKGVLYPLPPLELKLSIDFNISSPWGPEFNYSL